MKLKNRLEGGTLRVSASIGVDYSSSILALMRRMHRDALKGVQDLYMAYGQDENEQDESDTFPEHGRISPQARILFNALLIKYTALFGKLAKKATQRMISRVLKNSTTTLKMSLREMSEHIAVKTDLDDARFKDIVQASTLEATELIETIPKKYLADVQGALTRSITGGNGVADLVQHLKGYYGSNTRKARNLAFDLTHRTYNSINAARCQQNGMEGFIWIHSGAGKHPRKDHVEMNGKPFRFDDPPVIGHMYGQDVRGLPGGVPNCRCSFKPVMKLTELVKQDTKNNAKHNSQTK